VAVAVKRVHVFDAFANLLGRAAEVDAGIAPALVWAFIDVSTGVGDEIAAADKKGKVNAVAVLVQLCSKVGELLPALELGAVVEAHYDELRWPINAPLRRRKSAKHHQRRQCGDERSGGQCSPPTETDSDPTAIYPIRGVELIVGDTINCGAEQKLRRCDTNSTA
jgi:hypothetical protein